MLHFHLETVLHVFAWYHESLLKIRKILMVLKVVEINSTVTILFYGKSFSYFSVLEQIPLLMEGKNSGLYAS